MSDLTETFAGVGYDVELKDKDASGGPFVSFSPRHAVHDGGAPSAVLSPTQLRDMLWQFLRDNIVTAREDVVIAGASPRDVVENAPLRAVAESHQVLLYASRLVPPQDGTTAGGTASGRVSVDCPVTWTTGDINAFVEARYRTLGVVLRRDATRALPPRDSKHIYTRANLQLNTAVMTAQQLRNVLRAMVADSNRVPQLVFPQVLARAHRGRVFARFHVPEELSRAANVPEASALDLSCVRMTVPAVWDHRAVAAYVATVPTLKSMTLHHINVVPADDGSHGVADVVFNTKVLGVDARRAALTEVLDIEPRTVLVAPPGFTSTFGGGAAGSAGGGSGVGGEFVGFAQEDADPGAVTWISFQWKARGAVGGSGGDAGAATPSPPLPSSFSGVGVRVQLLHRTGCDDSAASVRDVILSTYGTAASVVRSEASRDTE
jgi:hypothetical protein